MSLLKTGYQTQLLLNIFIRDTPLWQLCNWLKALSHNFNGTTTLEPYNKQPFSTQNSFFLQTKSLNFSCLSQISEAATGGILEKKLFLGISQYSQESACVENSL